MVKTIVRVEFEKLLRKKSSTLILLFMLTVQIAAAYMNYIQMTKNLDLATGFQVAAFSLKVSIQMLVLIILVASCISLSEEISSGTVKLILTRSVKRCDFVLGKFLTLTFISTVLLILLYMLGFALGHIFGGLNVLKEGEYLLYSSRELTKDFVISMFFTIPPMISLIALGFFVSVLIKGAGGAVGTGIVVYFFLNILSQFDPIQDFLFTKYLSLPMDNVTKLVEGIYIDWSKHTVLNCGVSAVSIVVFMGLCVILFSKKDIWN